jgi:hypothetical protein
MKAINGNSFKAYMAFILEKTFSGADVASHVNEIGNAWQKDLLVFGSNEDAC